MEQPIDISDLDQGLDRDQLKKLKKRFLAISEERLARTRLSMSDRQQLVLDSLPALFHYNHPGLPGYVSHKTPANISKFDLSNRSKLAIKRLSRSFNFGKPTSREPDIYAIFIMGSVGTIAHGSRSDLDVWVCYRPGLDPASVHLLTHKGERISRWAQTQGVEVHCFPMDCDAFKSGRTESLDEESSGSSQHYLLLDEFYRTAIWLGGRIPLWWLIPPEREQDYDHCAELLLRKQFVRPKEVLDFGSAANIPPGEYVGAGIWHLYKGIDTPYKSVLKLLLLEVYASRHPNNEPLSLDFKRKVYAGETEIDQLDAYVCLYQLLQSYLQQRKETKRLELIRRAFYFKVHRPLTQQQNRLGWQWRALESLVKGWGWDKSSLSLLDNRKTWKAAQVRLEKHHLVHELISSYRFITQFANQQKAINHIDKRELETLGHKLRAAFDRKPGKVELINPDISDNVTEPLLMIRHRPDQPVSERWSVYALPDRQMATSRNLLLKQASQLSDILCWCLVNNVIEPQTEILIEGSQVRPLILREFISSALGCLALPLTKAKHQAFTTQSKLVKVMVFANLLSPPDDNSINLPSRDQDAFCFGEQHKSLIDSLDVVYTTSWNEIICLSFDNQPIQQFVEKYWQLCHHQAKQNLPEISVHSARSHISPVVVARLEEFIEHLHQAMASGHGSNHFIFQTESNYHLLRSKNRNIALSSHTNPEQLIAAMSQYDQQLSHWSLDSRALTHDATRLVLQRANPGAIDVFFYLPSAHEGKFFFVDNWQNLTVLHIPFGRLNNLLQSLHQFIRRIISQSLAEHFDQDNSFGVYPVHFYHLKRERGQWHHCEPLTVASEIESFPDFEVKAIAEPVNDQEVYYRFVCDQQELAGNQHQQLAAAAQFIRSHRGLAENYPLYINDLDLSQCHCQLTQGTEPTLGNYLSIKSQLESRLNNSDKNVIK